MARNGKAVKVVVLGPLPPPYGGPEVMTAALVGALNGRTELVVRHVNTEVSRSLAEKNGQHQLRKSFTGALQALALVRLLITFRPHVVYLPLTNSPSFLGFLRDTTFILPASLFRRRIAIRLHGGRYLYAHVTGLRRQVVKAVLGLVHLGMVQSERLKTAFNDHLPQDRIVVLPNGIDDAPFVNARATSSRRDTVAPRILFVGILSREKGFWDILHSIPMVPRGHFVFMGEWPSPDAKLEAEAWLSDHQIRDRVAFEGVVTGPRKFDIFASASIFVFPSMFVYEGHAVVSVEALAAGLPMISTDHGALNESVKDGWNGFFVPANDPVSIANRLNQLVNDPALRQLMGERSRELFSKAFTLETFVSQWVDRIKGCAKHPA